MPIVRWRSRHVLRDLGLTLAAAAIAATFPMAAPAADLHATPANLAGVFSTAQPGDTILLAAGNYGTFRGATKSGEVTLKPQPGAVAGIQQLDFAPATNVTIDGLKLDEIEIRDARSRNITIRNSEISGQTVLRTGELANASILFDRNVHGAWDKCPSCGEGRVWLPENTRQPSGITIQNSRFGPGGDSDGIQNGSNGTKILNNEFVGIKQSASDVHADAIQLYGSKNTIIRGNWFHDVSVGIMAPDGADREMIEDNVIQATSPFAIQLGSDKGSVVRHNTLPDGACEFSLRCGIIALGSKPGEPIGRRTTVTDNILGEISQRRGDTQSHNLLRTCGICSATDIKGLPTYVGGAQPTSYEGFALAGGSRGKGNASDGLDRGIRLGGGPPGGGRRSHSTSRSGRPTIRVMSRHRAVAGTGRIRLRVRTSVAGLIVIDSSLRPGRPLRSHRGRHSRKVVKLPSVSLTFASPGVRDITVKLSGAARRALKRSSDARLTVRTYSDARRTHASGRTRLTIGRPR